MGSLPRATAACQRNALTRLHDLAARHEHEVADLAARAADALHAGTAAATKRFLDALAAIRRHLITAGLTETDARTTAGLIIIRRHMRGR